MDKPYIICHMVTSIDGKITGSFLTTPIGNEASKWYYKVHAEYGADAFACGRVTMDESFTKGFAPDLSEFEGASLDRSDHIADSKAEFYAVAFDRRGRLGWKASAISDDDPGYDGAHIIEVLCEDAPDSYLAYLRSIGVSYIFGGKEDLDLELVLNKLYSLFGIKKLLLEGGSEINGSFQREGLIDELSLIIAPVVAEQDDKCLFEHSVLENYKITGSAVYDKSIHRLTCHRYYK